MSTKKYASLNTLQIFLDNIKNVFATKTEISNKADTSHTHDDIYYTKTEIENMHYTKTEVDSMEFITTNDIDTICGTTIQIASEVTF